VKLDRFAHWEKHNFPMIATDEGREIDFTEQPANADSPSVETLQAFPKLTTDRPLHH
jgi:hypothetical protein